MYAAYQKRAPDLITDDCEPPRGCWELNSGPLEEQPVLLTSWAISPALSNTFLFFFFKLLSLRFLVIAMESD